MKLTRSRNYTLDNKDMRHDKQRQHHSTRPTLFTSWDGSADIAVENLVVHPLFGEVSSTTVQQPVGTFVISNSGSAVENLLSSDVLTLPQGSHIRFGNDGGGDDTDSESNLWSLTSSSASGIESLLLNPIHEVAAFADEHIIAPTGEVISNTGEVISHHTSIFFQRNSAENADGDCVEEVGEEVELQEQPCIDVHPRCDREEVELIARHSEEDQITVSDSLLLGDPTGLEDRMLSMNLRVIRGRNLPFNNSRLRVSVLNENGVVDQVLGTTPWSKNYKNDPIWGTATCSWSLMGNPSTQLVFSLEQYDVLGGNDAGEKKEENREDFRKTHIFVKLDAGYLMYMRNPNTWIKLQDHGSTKSDDCGSIQVRLTQPKMATLHQQENCPRISPGPAFPRMESYAIRKQAMYCCSPVILNVYDVSNDSRIETINNTVKRMGYGGIFHAAIQIHGNVSGFGENADFHDRILTSTPLVRYRERIFLWRHARSKLEEHWNFLFQTKALPDASLQGIYLSWRL
jgi:hypothetical protein